jgi:hypothetical protein
MLGRDGKRLAAAVATLSAALACAASPAAAQYPEQPPVERPNPCIDPTLAAELRCPDLLMAPPRDLSVSKGGKMLLHATNDILSRGEGPLEVKGTRTSRRYMSVRQAIHRGSGAPQLFDTDAQLIFYNIPKQGPYWKFEDAAKFEIWSLDPTTGARVAAVRTGPKLNYCFRDLKRTGSTGPKNRVYPGCSQDPRIQKRTLGTSVGWSDIYPSDYYQNWINVSGLRGCFDFVLTADPDNYLFENNETNNEGSRRVRLPAGGKKVRGC